MHIQILMVSTITFWFCKGLINKDGGYTSAINYLKDFNHIQLVLGYQSHSKFLLKNTEKCRESNKEKMGHKYRYFNKRKQLILIKLIDIYVI